MTLRPWSRPGWRAASVVPAVLLSKRGFSALAEREVDVGERLGLDPLGGIDDEDRAATRRRSMAPRPRS